MLFFLGASYESEDLSAHPAQTQNGLDKLAKAAINTFVDNMSEATLNSKTPVLRLFWLRHQTLSKLCARCPTECGYGYIHRYIYICLFIFMYVDSYACFLHCMKTGKNKIYI